MIIKVKNLLAYKIGGAATLQEALERDLRDKYGNGIAIEFYNGLDDGRPLSSLSGRLVVGEPIFALCVRVALCEKGRTNGQ